MPYRRNVFIVGAGFSAEAGAPVVSNFFERAMELYKNPQSALTTGERDIFGDIFEYRAELRIAESQVRIDPENIEDLFGLVEMASQLGEPNAETRRRNLIYVILRTIELTAVTPPKDNYDVVTGTEFRTQIVRPKGNMYDLFVSVVARRWDPLPATRIAQDVIISLNYDLLLEKAIEESPKDERLAVGRTVKPWSLAPLYDLPSELSAEPAEFEKNAVCRIRLLKLHGSANWALCQRCKKIKVLNSGSTSVTQKSLQCSCGELMDTRLIVPPAWNKEEYLPLLRSVWKSASDALAEAQRIWIIGYSLPAADKFFQYLLALSLHKNKTLDQIVIVNSNPQDCQRIAGLFKHHQERNRIMTQQGSISLFMQSQGFQRTLHQFYANPEFAW